MQEENDKTENGPCERAEILRLRRLKLYRELTGRVVKVVLWVLVFGLCFGRTGAYFGFKSDDDCFCQLEGKIDECTCNIDTVDHFNNVKIYPRLQSLLHKDYFRFFKVNLRRECPFWSDDSRCAMRYCHVQPCAEKDLPAGFKGQSLDLHDHQHDHDHENPADMYTRPPEDDDDDDEEQCEGDKDHDSRLHYLNKTLSVKTMKELELWTAYDNALENFCEMDENDEDAEYVDLLLNPERYTGYRGESARRIWHSIYLENCFRPSPSLTSNPYIASANLHSMCLEERVFYRAISGLHASIAIHLSANYLLSDPPTLGGVGGGEWGLNLGEFQRRFSPETTNGEGPNWLRNLYFVYLLELRALSKAGQWLEKEEFYTGNGGEDWDTQMAMRDLIKVITNFPAHFDESTMFTAENEQKLKQQFKEHFRNVTRIMDCVGCDKCKLWGKLQTRGLGTAFKILFSGGQPRLLRNEIVSLVNAFGRLSNSIFLLDDFRDKLRHPIYTPT